MGSGTRLLLLISTLLATPVAAQELKPLCPDRGAFQPCTVDAGHVQVEVSIADWFDDADSTLLLADTVVRYGLDDSTEIQVGMSPFVRKSFGQGRGDLRLAVRKRLLDGDFSLAVQPTLIVPTGSSKLSGARVMPGLAVGTTYDISPRTQLYASPYTVVGERTLVGTFIGVNQVIKGPIGGTVEYMVQHQRGETQSAADFTLTYTATKNMEFDINANVGLTRQTPALEIVFGVTREF